MKPRHPASRECRKRKCQKRCCRPEDGRDRRSKRVTTAHVLQGGGALGYVVRAFLVVNCQSILMWLALRSCSGDFLDEGLFVENAAIEALGR
jgi:hypothetical protein